MDGGRDRCTSYFSAPLPPMAARMAPPIRSAGPAAPHHSCLLPFDCFQRPKLCQATNLLQRWDWPSSPVVTERSSALKRKYFFLPKVRYEMNTGFGMNKCQARERKYMTLWIPRGGGSYLSKKSSENSVGLSLCYFFTFLSNLSNYLLIVLKTTKGTQFFFGAENHKYISK